MSTTKSKNENRCVGTLVFKGTFTPKKSEIVIPEFTPEERSDFLKWLFSEEEIAHRSKDRKLAKYGLVGKHVSKQHFRYLHGSDMTERIYVAVREFERAGFTNRGACRKVAVMLSEVLGRSRRGRPTIHPKGDELSRKIGTVRSVFNTFAKRNLWGKSLLPAQDRTLTQYVREFLFLRKAGIVVGWKHVPDSGVKMKEYWLKLIAELRRNAITTEFDLER